jgi:hypothetical protein
MTSNNYEQTRPRIKVDESAQNRLRWFKNEYGLSLDRVYGYACEDLAEKIKNSDPEEIAENIEHNE